MPKIKLSVKEMKRASLVLSKEIQYSKAVNENTKKQIFSTKDKKDEVLEKQKNDIEFLEGIKNKFDIELFGRG